MKDGKLTMWQVHPERPDLGAVFEIEDEDHWARISFTPDEETGEWTPQYRLAATRIPNEWSRWRFSGLVFVHLDHGSLQDYVAVTCHDSRGKQSQVRE